MYKRQDFYGQASPPAEVGALAGGARAIAAGRYHSCAIRAADGAVVCWGENSDGRAAPPDAVNAAGGIFTLAIATPEPSERLAAGAAAACLAFASRRARRARRA